MRTFANETANGPICRELLEQVTGRKCSEFNYCYKCQSTFMAAIADQIERETLPRPRFEDGLPAQFGDVAMLPKQDRSFKVERIEVYDNGWFAVSQHEGGGITAVPGFMLKRPEQPDTWERIEADMAKNDVCDYYGRDSGQPTSKRCEGCRGQEHEDCIMAMTSDIVRRCKALAGVE